MMRVLFVTAEAYPFMKTGGLGDVSYALPKALKKLGMDVRVIMPKYKFEKRIRRRMKKIADFSTYIGWTVVSCSLWTMKYDGVTMYFVDNSRYFYRKNPYGYYDDGERFIYFSKAVLESIKYLGFQPDIMHCNDWHCALSIPLKDIYYKGDLRYENIKTIFSIHNILYQGVYSKDILWMLGIDEDKCYTEDTLKYYDSVSFMKWAITTADKVSTVSSSYAEEIKEEYVSFGLSPVFRKRMDNVYGILNGIDYDMFNPEKDKEIYKNFNAACIENKIKNKLALQKELGLEVDPDIPIIAVITRLTDQKGIDLIESALNYIMKKKVQFIVNGVGNKNYEGMLKYMESKYNGSFKACIVFDSDLAKRIYASSDMFLMPSKFEPCGLGQMIAMRYGTIPIVRNTGGLKDSVSEFNKYTLKGNGFTFDDYSIESMMGAIDNALKLYGDKEVWKALMVSAMNTDNTWDRSAKQYVKMYSRIMKKKKKKYDNKNNINNEKINLNQSIGYNV